MIPQKQPSSFREGLHLYKYQLDAVSWMKSVEEDVAAGNNQSLPVLHRVIDIVFSGLEYSFVQLAPWRAARTEILFDEHKRKMATYDQIPNFIQKFVPKGGVLADEVNSHVLFSSNSTIDGTWKDYRM